MVVKAILIRFRWFYFASIFFFIFKINLEFFVILEYEIFFFVTSGIIQVYFFGKICVT